MTERKAMAGQCRVKRSFSPKSAASAEIVQRNIFCFAPNGALCDFAMIPVGQTETTNACVLSSITVRTRVHIRSVYSFFADGDDVVFRAKPISIIDRTEWLMFSKYTHTHTHTQHAIFVFPFMSLRFLKSVSSYEICVHNTSPSDSTFNTTRRSLYRYTAAE